MASRQAGRRSSEQYATQWLLASASERTSDDEDSDFSASASALRASSDDDDEADESDEEEESVEGEDTTARDASTRLGGALSVPSALITGDSAPPTERDWSELFTSEPDTDDDEEVSGDTSERGHGVSESGGEGEGPEQAASPAAAPAEGPPTGGVARRTRAHLSLAHYDMDQLEEFLQLDHEGDFFVDEADEEDYQTFVRQIFAPDAPPPTSGAPDDGTDSDMDYEAVNPAARAVAVAAGPQALGAPRALPPRAARTAAVASGWPALGGGFAGGQNYMHGIAPVQRSPGEQENARVDPAAGAGDSTPSAAVAGATRARLPGSQVLSAAHVNAAADAAAAAVQAVMTQQMLEARARGDGAAILPPHELAKLVASAVLAQTAQLTGFAAQAEGQLNAAPSSGKKRPVPGGKGGKAGAMVQPPAIDAPSRNMPLPSPETAARAAARIVQQTLAGSSLMLPPPPPLSSGVALGGQAPPGSREASVVPRLNEGPSRRGAAAVPKSKSAVHTVYKPQFTALQLRCVRKQMHEHVQLLVQVLALSTSASGDSMASASASTHSLLSELVAARAAAMQDSKALYTVSLFAVHPSPADTTGLLYNGPGGACWADVIDDHLARVDNGAVYGADMDSWWPQAPSRALTTLLDVPSLAKAPELLAAVNALKSAATAAATPGGALMQPHVDVMATPAAEAAVEEDDNDEAYDPADGVPVPKRSRNARYNASSSASFLPTVHPSLVKMLKTLFGHLHMCSPALVAKHSDWPREQFTPGEDRLLATGVHTFGRNWALVVRHLLPNRTTQQITNRWKNATGAARNAKAVKGRSGAPLRAAAAAVTSPLSVMEMQAMRMARTALLGAKATLSGSGTPAVWNLLATHCWRIGGVQRPACALQKVWRDLLVHNGLGPGAAKATASLPAAPGAEHDDADVPAQQQQAPSIAPMGGNDGWDDALDHGLGGTAAGPSTAAAVATPGATALLHPTFLMEDAAPDPTLAPVTAAELRRSPASPMERYALMDAYIRQRVEILQLQMPSTQAAPVMVQPVQQPSAAADVVMHPQPPRAQAPTATAAPPAAAAAAARVAKPAAMPCHSAGGITALLDDLNADVGINVAVTGAPSWAPAAMPPGRGRHGGHAAGVRAERGDAAATAGADDTQTVATRIGGGATSMRRRQGAHSAHGGAKAGAAEVSHKRSRDETPSGRPMQRQKTTAPATQPSSGKTKRKRGGSKPAASSAGGTRSGGGRAASQEAAQRRLDDSHFVFDPDHIPVEERPRFSPPRTAAPRASTPKQRAAGASPVADPLMAHPPPTQERAAAATLSAMMGGTAMPAGTASARRKGVLRGGSLAMGDARPSQSQFTRDRLDDSQDGAPRPGGPVPLHQRRRVTFASAKYEKETLADSDGEQADPPPGRIQAVAVVAAAKPPSPPPPPVVAVAPPPPVMVPEQPRAEPEPETAPTSQPADGAATTAAPGSGALRDNEIMFEGVVTRWAPAEDKAIIIAAKNAPQGKPTLVTFALALVDPNNPLSLGSKSAAQAQARYMDLVKRMTAAAAARAKKTAS